MVCLATPPLETKLTEEASHKIHLNHLNSTVGVNEVLCRRAMRPHGKSRDSPEITNPVPLMITRVTTNIKCLNSVRDRKSHSNSGGNGKIQYDYALSK